MSGFRRGLLAAAIAVATTTPTAMNRALAQPAPVTLATASVCPAAVARTLAVYVPGASPAGLAVRINCVGVVPVDGVTVSHDASSVTANPAAAAGEVPSDDATCLTASTTCFFASDSDSQPQQSRSMTAHMTVPAQVRTSFALNPLPAIWRR